MTTAMGTGPGGGPDGAGPERRRTRTVYRSGGRRVSFRFRHRTVYVVGGMSLATVALVVVQLTTGDFHITPGEILRTLRGHGTPGEEFILYTLRLPRVLTAILVGIALGLSGALFQTITHNPLGSPDIIGFSTGASLGAVVELIVFHGNQLDVSLAALAGGMGVAVLVYLLSYRNGVQGYRLVLVGIGFSATLSSLVALVLARAQVVEAQAAYVWLTGSLDGRTWIQVKAIGLALVVLVPPTLVMSRRLAMMEMGDETARALGVSVERGRLLILFLGTALCAVAVAVAGPIAFVALAAPQIARRLCGGASIGLTPSMAVGALILVAGDLGAQRALAPTQLPVGVATMCVGGVYLAWLLYSEGRSGRA